MTRSKFEKVAQMSLKDALKISTAVFKIMALFQTSPKVNDLFGLLLKTKLLPISFKNRLIWSHWFLMTADKSVTRERASARVRAGDERPVRPDD